MAADQPDLPSHVEDTIESTARVRAAQLGDTSPLRNRIGKLTGVLGRPAFLGAVVAGMLAWIVINIIVQRLGFRAADAPPFVWMQTVTSGLALLVTILILSTQQRDDVIAERREHLSLQLALLADQRLAKIIALLEDLRRDDPHIADRTDLHAQALAEPTDPHAVSEAIRKTISQPE